MRDMEREACGAERCGPPDYYYEIYLIAYSEIVQIGPVPILRREAGVHQISTFGVPYNILSAK